MTIIVSFIFFWLKAKIIFQMFTPTIATVAIMSFLNIWDEFVFALILINENKLKTLKLGLATFIGPKSVDYSQLMAALTILTLSILIVYLLFSKKIVKGIIAGAVKG